MILSHLTLSHFRQYAKKDITLKSGTTILVGQNAIGKTNLLESIYLLSTGKSFHATVESEMIRFENESSRIKGVVHFSKEDSSYSQESESITLEVFLSRGEVQQIKTPYKSFLVNGVGKRMIDFAGICKVVLFWPVDLDLVTDSPSVRRKYLNGVLSQVDREYRRCLVSYEKALRQRNQLLEHIRDGKATRLQLAYWDEVLITNGSYITKKRKEYIEYINSSPVAHDVFKESQYHISYDASLISEERLSKYEKEEIAACATLVGPHRDDMIIEITLDNQKKDFKNLSHFGSRGEQRLGVLYLKIAELGFIKKTTGIMPIFLLDDVLSELDHHHRQIIFDLISQQQTIMTTTDIHFIDKNIQKKVEMIEMS